MKKREIIEKLKEKLRASGLSLNLCWGALTWVQVEGKWKRTYYSERAQALEEFLKEKGIDCEIFIETSWKASRYLGQKVFHYIKDGVERKFAMKSHTLKLVRLKIK